MADFRRKKNIEAKIIFDLIKNENNSPSPFPCFFFKFFLQKEMSLTEIKFIKDPPHGLKTGRHLLCPECPECPKCPSFLSENNNNYVLELR